MDVTRSAWGWYKTPCPGCKGPVEYWDFAYHDPQRPPYKGIKCRKCRRSFAQKEWDKISEKELASRKKETEEKGRTKRVNKSGRKPAKPPQEIPAINPVYLGTGMDLNDLLPDPGSETKH